MSYRAYFPERGDLVHLNFSPSAGHELADRHYAIVLSPGSYNRKTGMAVICGITSRIRGGPFEVAVPPDLLPEKRGTGRIASIILADAVRQIDYRERETEYVGKAPRALVEEVLDTLFAVLEPD